MRLAVTMQPETFFALPPVERGNPRPRWMMIGAQKASQRSRPVPLSPRVRDRVRGKETSIPPRCQNSRSVSSLKNIGAFAVDSMPFPLTPALSPGEREKLPQRSVTTTAQMIFQRTLSAPLSPGEREKPLAPWAKTGALTIFPDAQPAPHSPRQMFVVRMRVPFG